MFNKIILIMIVISSLYVRAHEGHNIVPGSLKANHGGIVQAGKEINLEYVISGTEVKLYPLSHDGQDLTNTEVKLVAKTKLPKGQLEAIKLDVQGGVSVAKVDFKNAYRVEMNVEAEHQGKKSIFKFQVEK